MEFQTGARSVVDRRKIAEHLASAERLLFLRSTEKRNRIPIGRSRRPARPRCSKRALLVREYTAKAPDLLAPKGSLLRAEIMETLSRRTSQDVVIHSRNEAAA